MFAEAGLNQPFQKHTAIIFLEELNNEDRGYARGPERALLSALLFDGVQSYLCYAAAKTQSKKAKYKEAFNWVNHKGREYVFNFENVCEALGVDPDFLRLGLLNVGNSSRTGDWKRSRRNF